MTRHLTINQKHQFFPTLMMWYGGLICLFCKTKLDINSFVYEHLNNNRQDNRIENIAFACQSCNNKKPHDADMQIIAIEQLASNEKRNFMGERKITTEIREASTEIEINQDNSELTEKYISERVSADEYVEFKDALDSIVYLCRKATGHGSQQSIRNYISSLTSSAGPFVITKDGNKKKIIVRRSGK